MRPDQAEMGPIHLKTNGPRTPPDRKAAAPHNGTSEWRSVTHKHDQGQRAAPAARNLVGYIKTPVGPIDPGMVH